MAQSPRESTSTTPGLLREVSPHAPTRAEVEVALASLEANRSLEDSIKDAMRQQYEEALEALAIASEHSARAESYREAARSGPERITALRAELEETPAIDETAARAESGSIEDLRIEIEARRAQLNLLRQELEREKEETARIEYRPLELSVRLPEVQRELAVLQEQLMLSEPAGLNRPSDAQRILFQARESMLTSELELLQSEQESQSVRLELQRVQQAVLIRRIEETAEVVDRLAQLEGARLTGTAERVRAAAARVPPELIEQYPKVGELAKELEALADELELALANTKRATSAEEELQLRLSRLTSDYNSIREQLQLGGGGRAMAQVLFALDRRCLQARDELNRISTPPLDQTRLAELRTQEKLQGNAAQTKQLPQPRSEGLARLIESRREILEELSRQYGDLVRALSILEQSKRRYLEQAETIRGYIGQQLFGFGLKACPSISPTSISGIPGAVRWTLRNAHWQELVRGTWRIAAERPLSTLAVLLTAAVLLIGRRRLLSTLEESGARVRRLSTDHYRATVAALLWTLLLAAPAPLLMLYLGWAMSRLPPVSDWMWGVTYGLQSGSWILFVSLLCTSVMRPQGLGAAHFAWDQQTLDRLRAATRALVVVYLPAYLLTVSCSYGDASKHFESLGRMSFIVAHLWMALTLYRLLFSHSGVPIASSEEGRQGILVRWRRAWSILLLATPVALVVLAMLGYLISALMLSLGLVVTHSLIAGGAVTPGRALRGRRMRQRRFAAAEALERRRARREAPADDDTARPSELVEVDPEEDTAPDLDVVAGQTRNIVGAFFGLATLLAVLAFWSRSFPLPELAGSVKLPLTGGTTLLDLAIVSLIIVVAVIVVRNLPGLLELVVLRTADVAPGTRHAISTLVQYAAIATAAAMVLNVVEVDWAKFGWIAAALSVGLGFGLQEVVANFVCGLILLFERPLRVGDIVTVEGMTGTVSKIHMRATTITNWDRQEFVVPNKTLITNTLLNWTLSAPLNRLVIPVGVAYGTDTEQARRILLGVATDHPLVLSNPEPMATFEQFADSALNLVLRAYLPDMESRLAILTELHTEIQSRFAAAGIEIAFPQLDLHLRSGWKSG